MKIPAADAKVALHIILLACSLPVAATSLMIPTRTTPTGACGQRIARERRPPATERFGPPVVVGFDGTGLAMPSSPPSPLRVSSGLTFDDGDQLLVSAQKPLGLVLEERATPDGAEGCVVAEADASGSAFRAGVRVGDQIVAVQNADVVQSPIEEILDRISKAPRVVNLRFRRFDWDA